MGRSVRNKTPRRRAVAVAVGLALSASSVRGYAQETMLRFPAMSSGASVPGNLVTPEQPQHKLVTDAEVDDYARRAAEEVCKRYTAPDTCTLKGIERRHVVGTMPASHYTVLDITTEVTNPSRPPEAMVSNHGILLLKGCPADSVLADDAGVFLANYDLRTATTAVACLSPDTLPKGDDLGQPKENGGNQCGVGNAPTVGNPINPLTMTKIETAIDFDGGASPGLAFVRFYHSGAFSLDRGVGKIGRYVAPARIGARWRHSWDRQLSTRSFFSGERAGYQEALHLIREDGSETRFIKDGEGYLSIDGDRGSLNTDSNGGWVYALGDGTTERFGSSGLLVSRADANGNVIRLEYERLDKGDEALARVIDPQGRSLALAYGADGQVKEVTTPDGGKIRYEYSPAEGGDDLTKVTMADGRTVGYLYDERPMGGTPNHKLTGTLGGNGERFATFRYDELNRAVWSEHGDGTEATWLDIRDGAIAVSRGGRPDVETWVPAYIDGHARLGDRVEAFGLTQVERSFDYLERNLVRAKTDYAGIITTFKYDVQRRLEIERTEAQGTPAERTVKTTWHTRFDKPTRVDTGAQWSEFDYDVQGNVTERRDGGVADAADAASGAWPGTRTTRFGYDLQGRLTKIDGPAEGAGDTVRLFYWESDAENCSPASHCAWRKGDLHIVTNAMGHTYTIIARDGSGRVLSSSDPNGVRTDRRYDAAGRLTEVAVRARRDGSASAQDIILRYAYDANGLLKTLTDPDGGVVTHNYNDARKLVEQIDAMGNKHVFSRNPDGFVATDSFERSDGTVDVALAYDYDDHGNPTMVLSPTGSLNYTFDPHDRLIEAREMAGRSESYSRDERGRIRRIRYGGADVAAETRIEHDGIDQVRSVTDPNGLTTAYLRNGLGDLLWQKSPDTGESSEAHDASGNLVEKTRADGDTVTRKYDHARRLTTVTYSNGDSNILSYDIAPAACGDAEQFAVGRLSKVEQSGNQTEFCYDFAGRVTRKIQTTRGIRLAVAYEYTPAGRLEKLTYPDGSAARYTRDKAGNISGMQLESPNGSTQPIFSNGQYDAAGHVIGWTSGSRQLQRSYNESGAIVSITDGRADGLAADFAYMGMLSPYSITSHGKSAMAIANTAGRITNAMLGDYADPAANRNESYRYDKVGNRLAWGTRSAGDSIERTYSYAAGTHHLVMSAGSLREYDAQGNTTRIDEREFVYDPSGRMVQAKVNGIAEMNYAYNIFGQQVARYIAGDTRVSLHDEAGHWIGDYDAAGRPIQQAAWLDDTPVALIDGNAIRDIQSDHLGSPRVVIDRGTDKAIWNWSITGDVFGNDAPDEDPDHDGTPYVLDMRFPGQRFDPTTKLFQNGWRDYDPTSGRYVQSDPIGLAGGITTFAYSGSNPLAQSDPSGLASLTIGGNASFIAGGGGGLGGGIYFSYTADQGFDAGVFGSVSGGIGANIGLSANIGYVPGPASNIGGTTLDLTTGAGPFGGTISAAVSRPTYAAYSGGFGFGFPAAGSLTATRTASFGVQDAARWVGSIFGTSCAH